MLILIVFFLINSILDIIDINFYRELITTLIFILIMIIFYFLWILCKKFFKIKTNNSIWLLSLLLNIPLISSFLFWLFNKKFKFINLIYVSLLPYFFVFQFLYINIFYHDLVVNYLRAKKILISDSEDFNYFPIFLAYYLIVICFYISKKIYLKNKILSYIFFVVFSIIFLSLWTIFTYNYYIF